MRKIKKILACMLATLMVIGTMTISTFADTTAEINVRVLGTTGVLLNKTVELPDTGGDVYVADVLDKMVADGDLFVEYSGTVGSRYATSIGLTSETAIAAGTLSAFAGWMMAVDYEGIMGVDVTTISSTAKELLVYYGAGEPPYGNGYSYAKVDDSQLAEGKIKITGTYFDWSDMTNKERIIDGATVAWEVEEGNYENLTTDSNGIATIPEEYRTAGNHKIKLSKLDADGVPVLEFYEKTIAIEAEEEEEEEEEEETNNEPEEEENGDPILGENFPVGIVVLLVAAGLTEVIVNVKTRKKYEK